MRGEHDLDALISAAREARRLEHEALVEICRSGKSIGSSDASAVRYREARALASATRGAAESELVRRIEGGT